MKFKFLTKEQIIISLDRITRFKNTKEKYLRVYSDILVSCLLDPKLRKADIEKMEYSLLADIVSEIINKSLDYYNLSEYDSPNDINKFLSDYENSLFNNDNEVQKLLNNKINYKKASNLIEKSSPVNLCWLKELVIYNGIFDINVATNLREEKSLKYPIKEVILVEGITEEILLPKFSQQLGYDFYQKGVQIIPAGGKNQVVKKYYELAEQLKLPIFVLLDKDAEENIKQIQPKLRKNDRIHLVSCGEFEDLLPKSLIIKTVNSHFKNFLAITEEDLGNYIPTAKILEELFKTKGLHEFKKAEFAKLVRDKIGEDSDISDEIKDIIKEISYTNKMLDSKFCS